MQTHEFLPVSARPLADRHATFPVSRKSGKKCRCSGRPIVRGLLKPRYSKSGHKKRPARPAFLILQRNESCLERERKHLPHVWSVSPVISPVIGVIDSVQRIGQDNWLTAPIARGSTRV